MLIAFNKPYGVLSQFTSDAGKPTLADFIDAPGVYAAGRLDADSEGLLLLTDDGSLQRTIADPATRLVKRYWAQVEGIPSSLLLDRFATGLAIGEGADRYRARPASAHRLDAPAPAERTPPIRHRANKPTCWIEIAVSEGKNRQVRRMTAAIGHPTLRLMRVGIGPIDLFELGIAPGVSVSIEPDRLAFASKKQKLRTASGGTRGRSLSTGFRSRRYWE
jgi:23S rRNA pseudouridine2457 synthase